MVRVLRSVTPGSLKMWGRQSANDNGNPKHRIFQLIKTGYEEVSHIKTDNILLKYTLYHIT